ncbi:MAG: sulfide dehydrogenase [Thermoleophilia bacterium]|nr:sulfide dehydrogenase [Thermoleophilia bacterium]
MLLALTGYETALLVVAAVFIAFALIVALVIPRSRPEFPGRRLGLFLAICAVLFAAQLTAVLVLAEVGEADEPVAHEETTPTETTPSETTTSETTTTEDTTTETPEAQGDPVAGKEVFLGSAGCSGCHTLADAGASGSVGPNLDAAKPSYDKVVTQVTNGGGVMPPFKDTLSEQQIQDVAAYVSSVAGS